MEKYTKVVSDCDMRLQPRDKREQIYKSKEYKYKIDCASYHYLLTK